MNDLTSLYFHFPYCLNACNYCDFFKFILKNKEKNTFNEFHEYLDKSYELHEGLITKHNYLWNSYKTIYIGGGTPSLWDLEGSLFFKNFLRKLLPVNKPLFSKEYEFTIEVNPATWSNEGLKSWSNIGVNRYSIGVQTLDPLLLKKIGRYHSLDQTIKTLEYFALKGLNFSVDFMLGLPGSQEIERDIILELEEILKYNPSHISLYILTPKSNYIHLNSLPDDDWISREYLSVANFLQENQFYHYEVSNFCKLEKESKHNLKYWKSESIAAFGPSATGLLVNKDSSGAVRYKWQKSLQNEYQIEMLNKKELKLEKLYMLLRTNLGISPSEFFKNNDLKDFMELVESWKEENLVDFSNNEKVILSSKGFLILDSLINQIFSKNFI